MPAKAKSSKIYGRWEKAIKADYHVHTNYSFDGTDTMEDMVTQAIAYGFDEIAFTDHVDYLALDPQYPPIPNFSAYKKELDGLRIKYRDRIRLIFGVEIGIGPHLTTQISDLTASNGFEFIIGSIHDINFTDIYYPDFFEDKTKDEAYSAFFEYTYKSVQAIDSFDVLGHYDYIERYGIYGDNTIDHLKHSDIIDETLRVLIQKGKGLELNTSGFRYGLSRFHPSLTILKRYCELGGEIITIGSDSHSAPLIGEHYNDAVEFLRFAGFRAVALFRENRPFMYDI